MPRVPRPAIEGGIYHVTSRGIRDEAIFLDRVDRDRFLVKFSDVADLCGWRCHAYCLMSTHYHLLVETPGANISAGMHRLNAAHARWFNWRHGFEGHLFQDRFHAVLVESDVHFLELFRYILLNPVRAGLCNHAAQWRWSSYAAFIGRAAAPAFLAVERALAYFGPTPDRARIAFERFVNDAPPVSSSP